MQILLSNGCVHDRPFEWILDAVQATGFHGIELLLGPELQGALDEYAELARERQVAIAAVHAPFFAWPVWGGDYWQSIAKSIEFASGVGAGVVTFHPPSAAVPTMAEQDLVYHLKKLLPLAEQSGIYLALENMPQPGSLDGILSAILTKTPDLLRFAIAKNLWLTLDATHLASWGRDVVTVYEALAPRVRNIHFSDFEGGAEHLLPGRGDQPLDRLLHKVREQVPPPVITLEIASETFHTEDDEAVLSHLRDAYQFIASHLE